MVSKVSNKTLDEQMLENLEALPIIKPGLTMGQLAAMTEVRGPTWHLETIPNYDTRRKTVINYVPEQ